MEITIKIIKYLYNIFRLGKLKLLRKYQGSIWQSIPISTEVKANKGKLKIKGKLSCRKGGYLSAGTGNISIGSDCFFNQNVMIVSMKEVSIGEKVIIGPNVVIVDHDHDYHSYNQNNTFTSSSVNIGNNVWIGSNVTILKGTTIGSGSVVGAGVTLKGTYPENTLIYCKPMTQTRTIVRKNEK